MISSNEKANATSLLLGMKRLSHCLSLSLIVCESRKKNRNTFHSRHFDLDHRDSQDGILCMPCKYLIMFLPLSLCRSQPKAQDVCALSISFHMHKQDLLAFSHLFCKQFFAHQCRSREDEPRRLFESHMCVFILMHAGS